MATAIPAPRLFSRGEFQQMVETGLLAGERVELLEGTILTMSPQNTSHAAVVNRLNYLLMRSCSSDVYIRVQSPITLDAHNQPEPDLVVCKPDPLDYAESHPQPDQVLLAIEVAEASLRHDRSRKAIIYARNGIPEYWIVDLVHRHIEVMTAPDTDAERYRRVRTYKRGQKIPLLQGERIAVSDILPPQRVAHRATRLGVVRQTNTRKRKDD